MVGDFTKTNPLLSIIIPTFNAEDVLHDCLHSIQKLDLEEVEVIIQDGSSTDSSEEIASHFDFCTWQSHPDEGVYDAMNKASLMARGKYLYFLGADDRLLAGFRQALEYLSEEEPDILYGNVIMGPDQVRYDGKFDQEKLARKNICHQAILYKRQLIAGNQGYSLRYLVLADYALNLKLFAQDGLEIDYLDADFAYFHTTGLSHVLVDTLFIRDKPELLELYGYTHTLPRVHAFRESGLSHLRSGSMSTGLRHCYSSMRLSRRFGYGLYLILAALKQRWIGG